MHSEIRVYWLKFWAMMLPVIALGAFSAGTFFGTVANWGDWSRLTWAVLGISGVLMLVSGVLFNRVIAWTGGYFQSAQAS